MRLWRSESPIGSELVDLVAALVAAGLVVAGERDGWRVIARQLSSVLSQYSISPRNPRLLLATSSEIVNSAEQRGSRSLRSCRSACSGASE
jgi:6,7-dimethyl-8-ribityllumazine synthase